MANESLAANTFRLDVKGAEVREELRRAGVRTVLLKGRAFAVLFYDSPSSRPYGDVDLLIDPRARQRARSVLADLGFDRAEPESLHGETALAAVASTPGLTAVHSETWSRAHDGTIVDLHDSLPQVGVRPDLVWDALSHHLQTMDIGGEPTVVLDRPSSALLTALHAAHHGPAIPGPVRDLVRSTDVVDLRDWREAQTLARSLAAEEALGIGLGLTPAGRDIADELGLPVEPTPAYRMLWSGAPFSAAVLASLGAEQQLHRRLALLVRLALPGPAAMRRGSTLAERGLPGLGAAYAVRLFRLARRVPSAVRAWRQARVARYDEL